VLVKHAPEGATWAIRQSWTPIRAPAVTAGADQPLSPIEDRGVAAHAAGASSLPDHAGVRVWCLSSAVSGIGQPIELASQAVQPVLDGSRCHPFHVLGARRLLNLRAATTWARARFRG
jgi:hypothetical protein